MLGGLEVADVEARESRTEPLHVGRSITIGDLAKTDQARIGLDLNDRLGHARERAVAEAVGRDEGDVDRGGTDVGDAHRVMLAWHAHQCNSGLLGCYGFICDATNNGR